MSEKRNKKKKSVSLGIKIVDGKTVIQYANGILTEDGFEVDTEYDYSTEEMCHWVSDDMSMKKEDLNAFLDLVIKSEFLSDGLLWGIALNTWVVISRLLYEAKLSTPIVFFVGEPGTLKTSVARMFLTTGTYRNGHFYSFEIPAISSAAQFKKQVKDVKSSLVLMDDIHGVYGYSSKDKMQNNIDTICREFYDYRNDSSLLITIENNSNLRFTNSFLQRTVWINFSNKIKEAHDEKEMYFKYIDDESDGILRILTAYQAFLLQQINDEKITSGHISQRRKTARLKSLEYKDKTERQNDMQVIFEFSMFQFYNFCNENEVFEDTTQSLLEVVFNTKNNTFPDFNFYMLPSEQRILHCLKYIGFYDDFIVTKPKLGKVCRNFKLTNQEFCDAFIRNRIEIEKAIDIKVPEIFSYLDILSYRNDKDDNCDYKCAEYNYAEGGCYMSMQDHKYCRRKKFRKSYFPTSFYLDESLERVAILIEDYKKISFISERNFISGKNYALMIVAIVPFVEELNKIYATECQKYNIEPEYLNRKTIIDELKKLGIIGYRPNKYYNKNHEAQEGGIYKFDFPDEDAFILRLPDEVYRAINSNIEKCGIGKKEEDANEETIFSRWGQNNYYDEKTNDEKLYEIFSNFNKIKFNENIENFS